MKTTLISAISVSTIALAFVVHGIIQGDASPAPTREGNQRPDTGTDAPKHVPADSAHSPQTNRRLVSEARLSKQRSRIPLGLHATNQATPSLAGSSDTRVPASAPGKPASAQRQTAPADAGLDGRNPHAFRIAGLSPGSNGLSISSIPATSTSIPSEAVSQTKDSAEDPYQTPQAAVLVDMGDLVLPDPARDTALQEEAERVLSALSEEHQSALGNPLGNPLGNLRREIVAESDLWFRQRYGGWMWSQHHVQAHHLSAAGN